MNYKKQIITTAFLLLAVGLIVIYNKTTNNEDSVRNYSSEEIRQEPQDIGAADAAAQYPEEPGLAEPKSSENEIPARSSNSKPQVVVEQKPQPSEVILFYGDGCPHCTQVEQFIQENDIDSKLSFQRKEIYYNKENLELLSQKAASCGIASNQVGVPFLWDGSKCHVGSTEVKNFFLSKID
jgi:glutaredoxin